MEKQVTEKSVTCFVLVVVGEQAPRHPQKQNYGRHVVALLLLPSEALLTYGGG